MAENTSAEIGREEGESQEINREPTQFETKIVSGDAIFQTVISFIQNAATKASSPRHFCSSFVYSITDKHNPKMAQVLLEFIGELMRENPGFKGRYITDIQRENVEYVKNIIKTGVEVRHIGGNRVSFSVSQSEYRTLLNPYQPSDSVERAIPESIVDGEIVWSNSPELVFQMRDVYERLWESAVPAALRLRQLEDGIDPGETRVFSGSEDSAKMLVPLFEDVRNEILVIAAPKWLSHRSIPEFVALATKTRMRGIDVRILWPSHDADRWRTDVAKSVTSEQRFTSRAINTAVVIFDRAKMLLAQSPNEGDTAESDTIVEDERISLIYTTNRQTIEGMASVFEALWQERELREKEERIRKEAELLRDLLSHDIRNRNQVALVMAELIRDELDNTPKVQEELDRLIRAIKSSNSLVDAANKLGRVLADKNPTLMPVSLLDSIREALEIVTKTYANNKVIRHGISISPYPGSSSAQLRDREIGGVAPSVVADHLLEEVFLNLYSNAVRYSPGKQVEIETTITDEVTWDINTEAKTNERSKGGFWKVSIIDYGRGIADELKKVAFARYLKAAEGTGLGLSIVYALVAERYGGRVVIKDRVEGDYTRGTRVEVWLPRAE